jgi:hypothetical protein
MAADSQARLDTKGDQGAIKRKEVATKRINYKNFLSMSKGKAQILEKDRGKTVEKKVWE